MTVSIAVTPTPQVTVTITPVANTSVTVTPLGEGTAAVFPPLAPLILPADPSTILSSG